MMLIVLFDYWKPADYLTFYLGIHAYALKQIWRSKADYYCFVYNNLNIIEPVYNAV